MISTVASGNGALTGMAVTPLGIAPIRKGQKVDLSELLEEGVGRVSLNIAGVPSGVMPLPTVDSIHSASGSSDNQHSRMGVALNTDAHLFGQIHLSYIQIGTIQAQNSDKIKRFTS